MKVKLNLANKQAAFLTVLLAGVLAISLVGAYNSGAVGGDPVVMGHSVDEMDWSNPIESDVYVSGDVGIDGQLDMVSNRIVNLLVPAENADAANKEYVDAQVSAQGGSSPIVCVAGVQGYCGGDCEHWTGNLCCVRGYPTCVAGTQGYCGGDYEHWTGTYCCVSNDCI